MLCLAAAVDFSLFFALINLMCFADSDWPCLAVCKIGFVKFFLFLLFTHSLPFIAACRFKKPTKL